MGGGVIDINNSKPADIVLYSVSGNSLIVVEGNKYSSNLFPQNNYNPVGIVVVNNGEDIKIMSLNFMNCDSPTTGSDTSSQMSWGYGGILVGTDYDNGRLNTEKIIEARGNHDYNTWKPIEDSGSTYPAASCCDMYYTPGTNQGDWYLPAANELSAIKNNYNAICSSLDLLGRQSIYEEDIRDFWSSSEQNDRISIIVSLYNGLFSANYKSYAGHNAIAFTILT